MKRNHPESEAPGFALVNLQRRYSVNSAALAAYARGVNRYLHLGKRGFNVCLVDDDAIRRLNAAFRGKDYPTDVLSFPWSEDGGKPGLHSTVSGSYGPGLKNFLGDIVISVETARRNAENEGHSTLNEIRWLILHGVLHLLGYDHETDHGEMVALELRLRDKLEAPARKKSSPRPGLRGKSHKKS
jgi:probable rRNA maturation factor